MANEDRTSRLKTTLYELVKQHIVYDGFGRATDVYTAHTDALNDTPCTRTRYTFDGTSSRIVGRKEENSTWNSAWDI